MRVEVGYVIAPLVRKKEVVGESLFTIAIQFGQHSRVAPAGT